MNQILNSALEYKDQKLSINQAKLDASKLPAEILDHLDLALANLNNAVAVGYIQVHITKDNLVQLIYPNSQNQVGTLNDNNNEVVYFDALPPSTYSAYMWMSAYGPSHWWKFWEWGAYVHFSEQAVENAKWVNIATSVINFAFLIKNIWKIQSLIEDLSDAHATGDVNQINRLKPELSKALGGVVLDEIGDLSYILALFATVVSFCIAISGVPVFGQIFWAALELASGLIGLFTDRMLDVDRGHGVKWQWPNFIPSVWTFTRITAE